MVGFRHRYVSEISQVRFVSGLFPVDIVGVRGRILDFDLHILRLRIAVLPQFVVADFVAVLEDRILVSVADLFHINRDVFL